MATSPIYSWPEPDNTDLVKNGALAIRTMGDAIDTTMGTMVAKTIIDAKGDLIAGTAADTAARQAVGSNYAFLQADSAQATGLLWNNAAWTSYTPTLTSQSGSITTATASGYYTRIGKLCAVYVRANITTAGTATGFLGISMPFTSANTNEQIFVGRETIATGTGLTGNLAPADTVLKVLTYNALTPIISGTRVISSGIFEVA